MPSWKNPAAGLWLDPINWNGGVPNAPGAVAEFTVTAPGSAFFQALLGQDVTVTVGTMTIVTDSDDGWSFSGAGGAANSRLVLQGANGSPAFLNVDTNGSTRTSGFSPFGFRMTFASDVIVTTQDSNTTLQMAADVDGTGDLYKFGAGTLQFWGNNGSWLGDANLFGGRTDVFQESNFNHANIRLDNHAVLVGSTFTLANRIEVGPGTATGVIASRSGTTLNLASRLIVSSTADDAVTFGSLTDSGTVLLTGTTVVTDTGGFVIAGLSVILGNADVAANYFSSLAPEGHVRITGQLETGGFAAHFDNLVLDGGNIVSIGGPLNLTVDDETNSNIIQSGIISATMGADRIVVNALTNFNIRGVTFSGWDNAADMITINGGSLGNSLTGGDQNDIINGNGGNDTLTGMAGADIMTGGTGNDTYRISDALDTLVEQPGEGVDTIVILPGGPTTYTIPVDFENLTFQSSAKNTGIGNAAANTIIGGLGDDILDGLGGADIMQGLGGNDYYFVDNAADQVLEAGGAGGFDDRVFASVSYALAAGQAVEVLSAADQSLTAAINLTGNALAQSIIGNAGANLLDSGGGGDTMLGLGGDDFYFVRSGTERAVEAAGAGNDRVFTAVSFALEANSSIETLSTIDQAAVTALNLTGNALTQTIVGNEGANMLDSGGGGDTMVGLGGDDFYVVRAAGDRAVEAAGGGSDRVFAAVSFTLEAGSSVEMITTIDNAATATINLTGNALSQAIFGNAGSNMLDGGGGGDTMVGFGGDDFYIVRSSADRAVEAVAGGSDRVFAAVSFALEAGSEVEILSTGDQAAGTALNLTGNALTQSIIGNAGANSLDSGGGGDVMVGLGGDDFYFVRTAGDRAVEAAGAGNDRVFAAVSFGLEAGSSIETLSTIFNGDTSAINLTGNELAQTIFGNAGANILDGKGGLDTLTGFGGADIFTFTTALGAGNIDQIADFVSGTDRIAIDDAIFTGLAPGALPANAFVIGASAGDADDRIIYNNATGALFFDADGNGAGAAVQFATLSGAPALAAADFAVI